MPAGTEGTVYMSLALANFEYKGDEKKTNDNRRDGFFTVGDWGLLDEDGYLFLKDRKSDMIISGGVNIYPAEIEGELLTFPKIGDVAVFGIPHEDWGEEIKAVVQPAEASRPTTRCATRSSPSARTAWPSSSAPRPSTSSPSCPATPAASSTSASCATRTGKASNARSEPSTRPHPRFLTQSPLSEFEIWNFGRFGGSPTCRFGPGAAMMGGVSDGEPRHRTADARRRAEQALPRAVDLWGLSWERDPDALDVGHGIGAPDTCLPASFPEAARVADADVTFVRARRFGLVHAMSTVFDDALSAHQAWLQLGDDAFVTCFAESVVAAVDLDGDIELLGPLVHAVQPVAPDPATTGHPAAAGTTTRGSRRTARARVALSAATDDALFPIAIDVAVILAGSIVVTLWAVERPGPAKDRGWARLVDRVERKVEVAATP